MVLVLKNLPASAGDVRDVSSITGWGTHPGGGNGNPVQYSCQENPTDRGPWKAIVHGVAGSDITEHLSTSKHIHNYIHTSIEQREKLIYQS